MTHSTDTHHLLWQSWSCTPDILLSCRVEIIWAVVGSYKDVGVPTSSSKMTTLDTMPSEQPLRTKSDVLASIGHLKQRIEEANTAIKTASDTQIEKGDLPSQQQQEEMAEVAEFVQIYQRNLEQEEQNLQKLMRGERLTF